MLGCSPLREECSQELPYLGMSLSHPGDDFVLGRMRCLDHPYCQLNFCFSFSSPSCSPCCGGCPTTDSLLARSLPSMSPAVPSQLPESCPPQRAHAKREELTHDSPEKHLPSRRMEKKKESLKCHPPLLMWETLQRHNQGTRVLPCAAQT